MEFESSFQNKWIICRTCLKSSDLEMMNIFENTENLRTKIEDISGIKLDIGADLPDGICHKCLTLLKAAFKFRTICQRSQKELTEQFGQSESIDNVSNEESLESNIKIQSIEPDMGTESKITNPEIPLNDEGEESLTYSVEYHEEQTEHDIDSSPAIIEDEAPFQVLREDNEMDNLELVLSMSHGDKDISSFKIVPQFNIGTKSSTTTTVNRTTKQRNRKINGTETSYVCTYCGNNYFEKSKLSLHMKIHLKEKPHQCEICLKRFSQTPQLARHMNTHTGSRPFLCKYCKTGFGDPSTRTKHERTHTNERPYKCSICLKAFSYSNVLKVHMMTHTGEKPHTCGICGKGFSQGHHKRNHERLCTNLKLYKPENDEIL